MNSSTDTAASSPSRTPRAAPVSAARAPAGRCASHATPSRGAVALRPRLPATESGRIAARSSIARYGLMIARSITQAAKFQGFEPLDERKHVLYHCMRQGRVGGMLEGPHLPPVTPALQKRQLMTCQALVGELWAKAKAALDEQTRRALEANASEVAAFLSNTRRAVFYSILPDGWQYHDFRHWLSPTVAGLAYLAPPGGTELRVKVGSLMAQVTAAEDVSALGAGAVAARVSTHDSGTLVVTIHKPDRMRERMASASELERGAGARPQIMRLDLHWQSEECAFEMLVHARQLTLHFGAFCPNGVVLCAITGGGGHSGGGGRSGGGGHSGGGERSVYAPLRGMTVKWAQAQGLSCGCEGANPGRVLIAVGAGAPRASVKSDWMEGLPWLQKHTPRPISPEAAQGAGPAPPPAPGRAAAQQQPPPPAPPQQQRQQAPPPPVLPLRRQAPQPAPPPQQHKHHDQRPILKRPHDAPRHGADAGAGAACRDAAGATWAQDSDAFQAVQSMAHAALEHRAGPLAECMPEAEERVRALLHIKTAEIPVTRAEAEQTLRTRSCCTRALQQEFLKRGPRRQGPQPHDKYALPACCVANPLTGQDVSAVGVCGPKARQSACWLLLREVVGAAELRRSRVRDPLTIEGDDSSVGWMMGAMAT
ncbi:MAG: hypothetical protein J3K34DRAFT_395110 [Monoraphidium minutum]|nr:MAG: hypothetical protein J3K34DRAFT_395110 [Monoraphidium minutum]